MIVVENLVKRYKNAIAVDNISFTVNEGETLVLLGTSGSGKTTTLRMINRLTEPSSGVVFINGNNIFAQPAEILRRNIGYVLQHTGLFPHYTVAENIAIVPQLLHWHNDRIRQQTIALMEKLQLPVSYLDAYPEQLSGGQQQRVGLARALAADPPILLMDEPFGALDPITRSGIRKEFLALEDLNQKTVILVTHDVQEAFELGDRICLMDQGKIVQQGTPAELLFHPANDFVRHFLDEQRLQLELKTVKIKDIWSQLGDSTGDRPIAKKTINWSESLWDVMGYWSSPGNKEQTLNLMNEQTKEQKHVGVSSLLAALNQFKQLS
ncbi:MAG: ABC transporter ATP-binding protein [Ginsengibacter sp.]